MAGSGIFFSVIPASAHAQLSKGRTVMAYVHITKSKGRGIEDFRTVSAKHSPPQDIDGLLAWAAGSNEDGLHVVTVWQSRAHQERWTAEQLFPVFQELGMTDVPVNSEFTEYETGELYVR
jgi:heme-degrading monooxygenase HmoA